MMGARSGCWRCWRWRRSDEGGAWWHRGSAVPEGGGGRCQIWAWAGRRWREAGLGEELEVACHNSSGRRELRESDAGQAQPECAAGRLHQLLSVPRRRAPSWGAVMSAWGDAVQEERGREVGAGGGGSDLQ